MPPALQRRFNLGIWYFDVPSAQERAAIWKIQAKRLGLEPKDLPDDAGWVGSDIRNCCQTAYMLNTSLKKAAEWITLVGRTATGRHRTAARPGREPGLPERQPAGRLPPRQGNDQWSSHQGLGFWFHRRARTTTLRPSMTETAADGIIF